MKNGDKGAYSQTPESYAANEIGVTKREYFAALAMQGLCAVPTLTIKLSAAMAVKAADALIDELDKK